MVSSGSATRPSQGVLFLLKESGLMSARLVSRAVALSCSNLYFGASSIPFHPFSEISTCSLSNVCQRAQNQLRIANYIRRFSIFASFAPWSTMGATATVSEYGWGRTTMFLNVIYLVASSESFLVHSSEKINGSRRNSQLFSDAFYDGTWKGRYLLPLLVAFSFVQTSWSRFVNVLGIFHRKPNSNTKSDVGRFEGLRIDMAEKGIVFFPLKQLPMLISL